MISTKPYRERVIPALVAIAIFFVVSAIYFAPQFSGDRLYQYDMAQYDGMTKEILDARQSYDEDPQWTGSMFGGMPAYLINVEYTSQIIKNSFSHIIKSIDTPTSFIFFSMVSMWVMLLIIGVNPWVGIISALSYGLSTYFILIIGAGHTTKMWALVYAPMMMGGAWMTLRGNMWIGASLTALFTSLQIGANHPQITYYFLMALGAATISEGIIALRSRHFAAFSRRVAVLALAGVVGVVSNLSPLWYTYEHTEDTTRGGSEIVEEIADESSGLDLDYATAWSYGKAESLNMLIPDFAGRESGHSFTSDSQVAATLSEYGLQGFERQIPTYWGDQPYTGGPTYLGAAAIFLAVLALLLLDGRNKWWVIAICTLMILLAWGRHLMWFTELAFELLPGYNKFRTVSMSMVVVQWAVPLLGALGVMKLWQSQRTKAQILRATAWAAAITAGVCLTCIVGGKALFGFGEAASADMMTEQFGELLRMNNMQELTERGLHFEMGESVATAMANDRYDMMTSDAWRSILMIALAAGCIALFAIKRIGRLALVGLLGAVILIDLVPVDMRFLSHDSFESGLTQRIRATDADRQIMADKELGYRVFNLSVSPFNDSSTSYFHRSIGGYHGAKLARYQDIIDRYLNRQDEGVLDMLNTKYLIVPTSSGTVESIMRTTANGAAWFVDSIIYAASPRDEIEALDGLDTKRVAVVSANESIEQIGEGEIALTEYRPNYLRYDYSSPTGGVAVFSEIFYDKGWSAYIDGEEAPYFRADYILRAMSLPAGEHIVEWRFRAPRWALIEAISLTAGIVIVLSLIAVIIFSIKKLKREDERE